MVAQRLSFDELLGLVEDELKAKAIWETTKDIISYTQFKSIVDLGITVGLNDLPFEKAMLYSWIKEVDNGRKT